MRTDKELSYREGQETAAKWPMAVGRQCGEEVKVCGRFYCCTREPHEGGVHVAHVPGGSAVATWIRPAVRNAIVTKPLTADQRDGGARYEARQNTGLDY